MNLVQYLSESRGVGNSARRLRKIGQRFGVSSYRMQGALLRLVDICAKHGAKPTLAVTANLIDRYPEFFLRLRETGAELAVHGYVHTDHALLDETTQYQHLQRALTAFGRLGLEPEGFRHPYLRFNDETWRAAMRCGFRYSSNRSLAFDVVPCGVPGEGVIAYEKGLRLYGAKRWTPGSSLPEVQHGDILDMPASLPDDEAIFDRLGLTPDDAGRIWLAVLDKIFEAGELMTFVVHNERVSLWSPGLDALLAEARKRDVWIATMGEIASWWRRRPNGPRWPNGAKAALTITSDVDAMSLLDFVRRPLEV